MQNSKCRIQKVKTSILHSEFYILHWSAATGVRFGGFGAGLGVAAGVAG